MITDFQCGSRKRFGTQHCFLLMIDKWEKAVDSKKVFAAILTNLSKAFIKKLIAYFASNQMNANHAKYHLFLSTQDVKIQIANITISCSRSQQLLGIVFDNKLKVNKHTDVCQKANRKLNATQE